MKLYSTTSLAEKQRMVETDERKRQEQAEQQQQQQMQLEQQRIQQQTQLAQQQQEMAYQMHREDNETKILVANINSQAEADRLTLMNEEKGLNVAQETAYKEKQLDLDAKQFAEKMALEKKKQEDDVRLKERQLEINAAKSKQ